MSTPVGDAAQAVTSPAVPLPGPHTPKRLPLHQRVTELESHLAKLEQFVTQMAADVGRELGL